MFTRPAHRVLRLFVLAAFADKAGSSVLIPLASVASSVLRLFFGTPPAEDSFELGTPRADIFTVTHEASDDMDFVAHYDVYPTVLAITRPFADHVSLLIIEIRFRRFFLLQVMKHLSEKGQTFMNAMIMDLCFIVFYMKLMFDLYYGTDRHIDTQVTILVSPDKNALKRRAAQSLKQCLCR